jgi:hypothetical protein
MYVVRIVLGGQMCCVWSMGALTEMALRGWPAYTWVNLGVQRGRPAYTWVNLGVETLKLKSTILHLGVQFAILWQIRNEFQVLGRKLPSDLECNS